MTSDNGESGKKKNINSATKYSFDYRLSQHMFVIRLAPDSFVRYSVITVKKKGAKSGGVDLQRKASRKRWAICGGVLWCNPQKA